MWRINGVQYYRLLLALLIIIQLFVLISVGVLLGLEPFLSQIETIIIPILIAAIIITLIMVINIVAYTVIFHTLSNRTDHQYEHDHNQWLEIWTQAFFTNTPLEEINVTRATATAMLELSMALPASDQRRITGWAQRYGILDYWQARLKRHNLSDQLEALNALATLGTEQQLVEILQLAHDGILPRRVAALETAATLIPQMPDDMRYEALKQIADVMTTTALPVIVLEGVYGDLGALTDTLIGIILQRDALSTNLLIATINTISRFYLANRIDCLIPYIKHEHTTIRIITLRAFTHLKAIPPPAFHDVLNSIRDTNHAVRQQAVDTLATLPLHQSRLPLWLALGDDDWWVRFAAGRVLYQYYGEQGRQILHTASQKHHAIAGREMATEILKLRVDMPSCY